MKKLTFLAVGLVALAACNSKPKNYNVTVNVDPSLNGQTVVLVDQFTGDTIDSATVADSIVVFENSIAAPTYVAVMNGEMPLAMFFLENDSIKANGQEVTGGELNAKMTEFNTGYMAIAEEFQAAPDSLRMQAMETAQKKLDALADTLINQNKDNALGSFMVANMKRPETKAQYDSIAALYPIVLNNKQFTAQLEPLVAADNTSVGKKFVDFTVQETPDKTFKFSDVVGKGKFVLVDFWASWCGPCRRQIPVIKELYKELGPKGLEVLGICVWDKQEDSEKAIKEEELPWQCVINADKIPTDLYGIQGIPCIMLIGPDGTILSRDKQGDELVAEVKKAMGVE